MLKNINFIQIFTRVQFQHFHDLSLDHSLCQTHNLFRVNRNKPTKTFQIILNNQQWRYKTLQERRRREFVSYSPSQTTEKKIPFTPIYSPPEPFLGALSSWVSFFSLSEQHVVSSFEVICCCHLSLYCQLVPWSKATNISVIPSTMAVSSMP